MHARGCLPLLHGLGDRRTGGRQLLSHQGRAGPRLEAELPERVRAGLTVPNSALCPERNFSRAAAHRPHLSPDLRKYWMTMEHPLTDVAAKRGGSLLLRSLLVLGAIIVAILLAAELLLRVIDSSGPSRFELGEAFQFDPEL